MCFGKFNKWQLSVVLMLIFVLLFSAFNNAEGSFSQNSPQNNNFGVLSAQTEDDFIKSNAISPVAIMFLLDISGSVVGYAENGKAHCPAGEPPLRKKALDYFLNILAEMPEENSNFIHIGVSQFGSAYKPVLPMMSSNQLYRQGSYAKLRKFLNNTKDMTYDISTGYSTALKKGSDELQKYGASKGIERKILILLSDGFDPDIVNVEDTLGVIPFDIEIYLAPVCPTEGDLSFWRKHRIPSLGSLQNDWVKDALHESFIADALPKNSGWVDGDVNELNIEVSGDASSVLFSYLPYSETSSVKVNDQNFSGVTLSFKQLPQKLCLPQTYTLQASSSDQGFWWVDRIDKPSVSSIFVEPISEKLVANNLSEIKVQIKSNSLAKDDFQKWRDCLSNSIDLAFYDSYQKSIPSPVLSPQKCEADTSSDLCPVLYGDALEKSWKWFPPNLSAPSVVYIAPIYTDSVTGLTIIGSKERVQIYLKPEVILVDRIAASNMFPNNSNKYYFVFDTKFDVAYPNIYLTRTLQNTAVPNSCPALNAMWQGQNVHAIPQSQNNNLFAHIRHENNLDSDKYELELDPKALDKCGFDLLVFSWGANDSIKVISAEYVCNLIEQKCARRK